MVKRGQEIAVSVWSLDKRHGSLKAGLAASLVLGQWTAVQISKWPLKAENWICTDVCAWERCYCRLPGLSHWRVLCLLQLAESLQHVFTGEKCLIGMFVFLHCCWFEIRVELLSWGYAHTHHPEGLCCNIKAGKYQPHIVFRGSHPAPWPCVCLCTCSHSHKHRHPAPDPHNREAVRSALRCCLIDWQFVCACREMQAVCTVV